MKVVKKYTIPYADLTSNCTNSETVWSAGTYSLNDVRWHQKKVYKVVVASTTATPGTSTDWEEQGATNIWSFSDNIIGNPTTNADTIEMTIANPSSLVNAISFFKLVADTVQVIVTDTTDGEVYNKTVDLNFSPELEADWYSWFFSEFSYIEDYSFTDLPAYFGTGVDVDIVIDNTGETAEVGEIVMGNSQFIGETAYPISTGILDYSRKTTDDNGNFIIEAKPYAKRADYVVTIEASQMAYVQKVLTDLRNTATVFIGDEDLESSITYGFYKDFNLAYDVFPLATVNISVEGLT